MIWALLIFLSVQLPGSAPVLTAAEPFIPFAPGFNSSLYPHSLPSEGLPVLVRPPHWLRSFLPPHPQAYIGLHNDLPALLKLRSRDNWITVSSGAELFGGGDRVPLFPLIHLQVLSLTYLLPFLNYPPLGIRLHSRPTGLFPECAVFLPEVWGC